VNLGEPVNSAADDLALPPCGPDGPNSALDELGPSYVEVGGRALLYFSSGPDIYVSEKLKDGCFGPAAPVAELNGAASDIQPNVRKGWPGTRLRLQRLRSPSSVRTATVEV
jgi:hypothetical protein